jgi:hypothetical protein
LTSKRLKTCEGQVLVILRAWRHSGSRLVAAAISPRGEIEATHVLETGQAEPEGGHQYEDAIGPGGQELVISTDAERRIDRMVAETARGQTERARPRWPGSSDERDHTHTDQRV